MRGGSQPYYNVSISFLSLKNIHKTKELRISSVCEIPKRQRRKSILYMFITEKLQGLKYCEYVNYVPCLCKKRITRIYKSGNKCQCIKQVFLYNIF